MNHIKAIETTFKGYRFRSRLEARWAVFFDDVPLAFEYELEGYEVAPGVRYLPDFYLPEFKCHVEVKPNVELPRKDLEKMVRFAADCNKELLLIIGTPGSEQMYLLSRTVLESWDYYDSFEGTKASDAEVLEWFLEAVTDWAHVEFGYRPQSHGVSLLYKTKPPACDASIGNALIKARQARFEHGRSGN